MPELLVSKKSIGHLFSEMQNNRFIVPDFQRQYVWDKEKCETLWNDIQGFSWTSKQSPNSETNYYLGTVVSYTNDKKQIEIIDGQQRIISLFLLLRAFYKHLESMTEDNADVIGLKSQLAPCIWDIDPISTKISDTSKIHIESLVATETNNEIFHEILRTGNVNPNNKDNYSQNYIFFKKQCEDYALTNPMEWKTLCVTILRNCIVLPIECDASETALTIFSTLNDRGLPLDDSDIFKAEIYKNCKDIQAKKDFTDIWKELTNLCDKSGISINDIFRYYTHVLRSRDNVKEKEKGLRKFYAENHYQRLKIDDLMDDIMSLAKFWLCINKRIQSDKESGYVFSTESQKYLHCLAYYPNEFWKYIVSVFFIKNKGSKSFDADFSLILKKLIAFLFAKFIEKPTVNAIKDDIYSACVSIQNNNELHLQFGEIDHFFGQKLSEHAEFKLARAILLLHAYRNPAQENLIPELFDIEHIFPQKWQNTNYNGWDKGEAESYLNRFGNKIVIEKKLNIQAGNGYFGNKKKKYQESEITCVKELATEHKNDDWVKEDIEAREEQIKSDLTKFFSEQLISKNKPCMNGEGE